eukprot:764586-Hanusia_phi.AAC.3
MEREEEAVLVDKEREAGDVEGEATAAASSCCRGPQVHGLVPDRRVRDVLAAIGIRQLAQGVHPVRLPACLSLTAGAGHRPEGVGEERRATVLAAHH